MRQKIKLVAKDSDKTIVSMDIKIDASKYVLTAQEQRDFKKKIADLAFNILRDARYHCQEIRFK